MIFDSVFISLDPDIIYISI